MLLIDNNLSPRLVRELNKKFKEIVHVVDVGLEKEDDPVIWQYALDHKLHILTKDKDFNGIQSLKGFPPKIIWLRTGNVPTKYIIKLLSENYRLIYQFIGNDDMGILEVY